MPASLDGDYSKFPSAIQDTLRYIAGETCELRQSYGVYHRLFMDDQRRTEAMSKHLGAILGLFQNMLQDEMFLSIARLTDKNNRQQPNLSVWCLEEAVPFASDPTFQFKVSQALSNIWAAAETIRKHRHKRIAHFERNVSIKTVVLPTVTFTEIRTVIELIEEYLKLFYWEFEQTTMYFDLAVYDITDAAEKTVLKARAYDVLASNGTIPPHRWYELWRDESSTQP